MEGVCTCVRGSMCGGSVYMCEEGVCMEGVCTCVKGSMCAYDVC